MNRSIQTCVVQGPQSSSSQIPKTLTVIVVLVLVLTSSLAFALFREMGLGKARGNVLTRQNVLARGNVLTRQNVLARGNVLTRQNVLARRDLLIANT